MNTRRLSVIACALGLLAAAVPAIAQGSYPDKPVKVIVALPAGGGVDMIARVVGQKLQVATGQPFLVDN
nr:tripartite tricarboxylate transporter substrate binding protein [Burkholderiaceae bacterium]